MTEKAKIRVAVLAGGPSPEHEVSLATARNVLSCLDNRKYQPKEIRISQQGDWYTGYYRRTPKAALANVDVVFNALHGAYGEDGKVQSLLNKLHVPYTGAGAVAAALTMDKLASRKLFIQAGLTAPQTIVVRKDRITNLQEITRKITSELNLPTIIKPNNTGSSIGITIADNHDELQPAILTAFKHDTEVLAEQYLKGVEVTAGVLDTNSGAIALPPVMIIPLQNKTFFDYEAKYNPKFSKEVVPAPLGNEINKKVQAIAVKAHQVLGLRHYSRTDMIVAGDKVYVLETNALPGLTANSLLPKSLTVWGMNMQQFVDHVIDLALMGR